MAASARAPGESLDGMLRIELRGAGDYAASLESFWGGTARGDLLARMALAVMKEAGSAPTSLHASFVAKAVPDEEVSIHCEPPVSVQRRVHLSQRGAPICEAVFRFDPPSGDLTYQRVSFDAGVPAPESLSSEADLGAKEGWGPFAVGPIESRRITSPTQVKDNEPAVWSGWLAPRQPLPKDQTTQTAALVFLSEYRSHWAVERCLGPAFRTTELALNDFALWIHRPVEWNDFWLVTTRTDVSAGGRCLSRREIFTRQGSLVASAAWQLSASRSG